MRFYFGSLDGRIAKAGRGRGLGSKILKEQLQIFLTFDETMEPS